MGSEDDAFAEIVENVGERIHISISQDDDCYDTYYDVSGTADMDVAIGVALKGLFLMLYDTLIDVDDGDDEDDDI